MKSFIYLSLLIFIIIFCAFLYKQNTEKCPIKVKNYYSIVLSIALVRYISIFIAAIIKNQKFIGYIRSLTLLNYIFIPALGVIAIYIFLRDDKIKFSYNIILFLMTIIIYIVSVLVYKINISIDKEIGFVFNFRNYLNPNLIYLIELSIIVVVSIFNIDKKYINKNGIILILISSIFLMGELLFSLVGIKIFTYQLFGEIIFLLVTNKAINTFKVTSKV